MKQKKIYLEAIRIFAIFFVVYVHTGIEAAEHYTIAGSTFSYILSLVLYAIAQISVPLFFMVTGAVLLHKEESLRHVLLYRALRILLIILIFGFVEYAYFNYLNPGVAFSIPIYLWTVYSTTVITQYWYIYAYFALMLILPFIRMMARSMKNSHFWYLFTLFFVLDGILPIVEYLWGNNRIAVSIPLLADSVFYLLMGYYIVHRSEEFFYRKRTLLVTNIMGIMALLTNTVVALMAHRQRGAGETLGGMTAMLAVVTFINFRAVFNAMSKSSAGIFHGRFAKLVCTLILFMGSGSFGVYLLEPPLRDTFKPVYIALEPYISWFPAAIVWILVAMVCGSVVFFILRKIPLLKKLF